MDDGELDFSSQDIFSTKNIGGDGDQQQPSCSMDSFFDEIFKDTHACTHTHTCNPPGPDLSHTHTCFHVHTKIVSAAADDDKTTTDDTAESAEKTKKKRPLGNREAVRKYREKKKARAASLEDEVVRLRTINQQLMKRLQGQAVLEAEIARLKCLLVDIRGRIEGEIGSFPYQKMGKGGEGAPNVMPQLNMLGGYVLNSCDLRCDDDQIYCLHPGVDGKTSEGGNGASTGPGFGVCDIGNVQCMGNLNPRSKEFLGCESGNLGATGISSTTNRRKGDFSPHGFP
ncbi:hypothetical protein ACLOJK_028045 [Asimina triloba]